MAQVNGHQRRHHVQRDLLRGARAHARGPGDQLWRRGQANGDISPLQQRRVGGVCDGDKPGATGAGFGGQGAGIGGAAGRAEREDRVGGGNLPGGAAAVFGVILAATGHVRVLQEPSGGQDQDAVCGDAEGAGQFGGIRHAHQGRGSGCSGHQPAAVAQRIGQQAGGFGDLGNGLRHGVQRLRLPVQQAPQRVLWCAGVQAV